MDHKMHVRRLRYQKAQVLLPLLCILCFLAGLLTLAVALLVFRKSGVIMPAKWAWFCLSYFVAGIVFLVATRLMKLLQPKQEYSYRKRK
jgi:drug/metabolite transporter (DMT)-like permease